MGRKRQFRTSTWRGKELYSREELKRAGVKVAPYVSYEKFKRAWKREHKGVETPEAIIRQFWGDYITSDAKSLSDYFRRISQ
jgi:hypothetical protein